MQSIMLALLTAATAAASPADQRAEKELIRLETEWAASGPTGDNSFFERIAAEDYLIVDVDGSVRNKQQELAQFRQQVQTSQTVRDMKVRLYGDTAVVVGRFTISGTQAGKPNNLAGVFTDVWIHRNGRWKLVSNQNTSLPAETAAEPDSFFVSKERKVWEALRTKDKASDSALLAADFVGLYDTGFATKQETVHQLDGQYAILDYKLDQIRVIRPSASAALLLYRAVCKGSGDWQTICARPLYISSLWVERGGAWLNLFSQDTQAAPGNDTR